MSLTEFIGDHPIDLLTTHDLMGLPPPQWLMRPLIPENGLVGLYGAPSGGKSFIALDWAMCISEGMPWLGKYATKQSPVIYIAAEGGRGIQKRVRAWMRAKGLTNLPAMYWMVNPLYVREEGIVEAFLDELESRDIYPGLVVLDTLSRSFGGGEENSSADMGQFVDAVMRMAAGRYMSALIVHHTNATGARERGHTSFRGALDAMFSCVAEKNGDGRIVRITLANDKQKDEAEADAIYVAPDDAVKDSLVFVETGPPERKERKTGAPKKLDMLSLLQAHPEGLTVNEWLLLSAVPRASFFRRMKRLLSNSDVYKDGGKCFCTPENADLADTEDEEDE